MTNKKMMIERRKHRRFKVQNESFYIVNPISGDLGEIIDISLGGLAFYHIKKQLWGNDLFKLGTLIRDNDEIIRDLPMKTVSESVINPIDPGSHDDSTAIWRRSVEFGELTSEQTAKLEEIIQNCIYTEG